MSSTKYQYCIAIIANLLTMTFGIACGWVSPYLPYLSSNETPLDAKLTVQEASLIAALISGGGFFGNIIFAWMSNKFGRKYPLMLIAIPQIVGWILTLYAKNAYYLYAARFLIGLVGGGAFVIVPVFISEIAEDRIRGTLGSFLVLAATLGTLLEFIFGEYCSYSFTPILVLAMTLVFLGGVSFFPESPAVLYKANRMKEAEKSICFYRRFDLDSKAEMEILQVEMNKLELSLAKCTQEDSGLSLADFMTTAARKSMLIGLMLAAVNQLCGCFAMINYTATIFRESGSTLTPNGSAIVVGCLQVCGAYASTVLVDRAGRKFLLAVSAAATSFGLAGLGAYLYLKSAGFHVEEFGWIPIACFSFGVFFAHWGVLTLPFLVISEILPDKIKNAGSAICMAFLSAIAFFMVKFFPMLSDALGMHGSMFLFATFSMAGAIFVMTVMPETKGKSFDEIMKLLER